MQEERAASPVGNKRLSSVGGALGNGLGSPGGSAQSLLPPVNLTTWWDIDSSDEEDEGDNDGEDKDKDTDEEESVGADEEANNDGGKDAETVAEKSGTATSS